MLYIITEEKTIRRGQALLMRSLMGQVKERLQINLGHPGKTIATRVYYLPRLDIWFCRRKLAGGRFSHAFGCGRPAAGKTTPITCEINLPAEGIDRRVGGMFARDLRGELFLLHRGRLGGSKKGTGLAIFRERYRGLWTWVTEGEAEIPAVVVGELKSSLLARQVAQFVFKVEQLKREPSTPGQLSLAFDDSGFQIHQLGNRREDLNSTPNLSCERYLVVEDLARELTKHGYRVGNDPKRDLWISSKDERISHIFEIRTDCGRESLEAGTARLLWNNAHLAETAQRYLVLPQPPNKEDREKLEILGIRFLTYLWQEDYAVFNLPKRDLPAV